MKKKRLDDILIERGFAENKVTALKIILGGYVLARGQKAISPSQIFLPDVAIVIKVPSRYVGRGGEKLAHAIKNFGINVSGMVCLDIGAATGGFTDVLLQNSAQRVYAVDTAKGKLALKLRTDQRVIVMEEINVSDLRMLPEKVDCACVDVSLMSLRNILPLLPKFLKSEGFIVALFKPQYEVLDKNFLKYGVLENKEIRKETLNSFLEWLKENNWNLLRQTTSPIRGAEGNVEYLLYIKNS